MNNKEKIEKIENNMNINFENIYNIIKEIRKDYRNLEEKVKKLEKNTDYHIGAL